ncbi:bifunctional serine/threonine-protein kinase/formylglycine-generating enzyme family protein [Rubripirellula reticaptiva]|uniref:non-specific serine/threonine protein kinase n=1 Tax=Rubripirellula reticaptiva TaxID=2528013 RepID=A0A5C6EH41_9BACT|nr:bifunctional serine/threonine-protein kinase/formylglycine-generating enzyme family protein [Rubripirellula reticaptiva]TWU49143.1 Serine/threonine-protein kinase PrkC [Rubripirellula reticaptiva]
MSDDSETTKHADFTSDAAASAKEIPMPDMIGRYRVSGVIGRGGFGTVFRATDDSLAREVAIKVPRRFTKEQAQASHWNAEAKMVAMLDHPNIVPVYDVGSTDEFPFFVVSKFIEGIDLRERLQRRKPSIEQSIAWMLDMAEALQHAHEKGLVHRDVKPSNILIEKNDRPWLTDFGLAIRDDDIARQTNRKLLVGTFSYMSPEQARGEGHLVDGRSDVFALGIVLYELLLGKRPFTGGSSQQLLQNIVRAEPRPLRQLDPTIDGELERICMKALAQRLSDRYNSGRDMADDLRRFANCGSTVDHSADFSLSLPMESAASPSPGKVVVDTRVIPKGLRAFDEHDQDFFLKLVPGTRDANGIPEVIRRLKIRIESRNLEESFRVGLIYGSSGSGKSSLIRAGLAPLLNDSIHVAYLEANAKHTESRMRSVALPLLSDQQQDLSLVQCMAAIRKGAVADGKKVVIFIDQFEQWLHSHPIMEDTELVNAIRQCDGIHLQCIVLIRDDFWMPATRFFHELDIRLVQDVNSTAVDRFELRHARYVLTEFGRAYGCLPDDPSELSSEQQQFIHTLVDSVQEDGKVISIHLVVLSQMLKGREWNLKTLAELGGAEGVDINFLDATFNNSIASPHHRSMQKPARAVLTELLPEVGTNIKGQMKDAARLREVSGLNQREFEELLAALDGELRMITPTAADGDAETSARSYQLTHDFLVPPLREWLTRSNRQTPQGRAKLRLSELTQYWRRKKEKRFLPSGLEYLRILAFTSASNRTADESSLVAAATRYYGSRWAIAAMIAMLIGWGGTQINENIRANLAEQEVKLQVQRLLAADTDHVLDEISRLQPIQSQAEPLLQSVIKDTDRPDDEILAARLALIGSDPTQTEPLIDALMIAEVNQISLISDRLELRQKPAVKKLWEIVQSGSVDEMHWIKAAFATAQLDPDNQQWEHLAERLAGVIVNQSTPLVVEMAPGFAKLSAYLSKPTQAFFRVPEQGDVRLNSAILLSKCLKPTDTELKDLLSTASPDQFELLLPVAALDSHAVVAALEQELTKAAMPKWPKLRNRAANETNVDAATLKSIKNFEGIASDAFIFCQRLPLDQFEDFADHLDRFGYRPSCVRAYRFEDADFVTAIWIRDGLKWKFTRHQGHQNVPDVQEQMHKAGLFPADFTAIPASDTNLDEIGFGILWTQAVESMIDSRIYVGLKEEDHQSKGWEPLNDGGYVPKSNLKLRYPDGTDRYSSVRWRTVSKPRCNDAWNDSAYAYESRLLDGWHQTDVRINPAGEFDEQEISFAAVWWNGGTMQSQSLNRVDHQEHLQLSQKLIERDFRPVSISVVFDDNTDKLIVASVWHRPIVSDEIKDELASRQANAVVALLRLGSSESLWPLLQSRPDSRLRSYLIDRMASLGVDPEVLVRRLMIEPDESRRVAIIAALAQYRPEQLPSDIAIQLRDAIGQWGSNDPSAAIQSICKHLCVRWKWPEIQNEIDLARSPSVKSKSSIPTWYRNTENQTMVVVAGPVEFRMGSPGDEAFRDHHLEVSINSRIPRSFAIGSTEVTVAEFQRYNPTALYATEYTHSKDCPITAVSWYDAMFYCRWLSEQEGIPEDQMCYPPIDQMITGLEASDGFQLPNDFLKRIGYRLPTEAEWEYASRAKTTTPRHYGNDAKLLPKYAWTTESSATNSQVRFHPVGQLLPNGFGLFDTLGNVMEWCEASPPRDFNLSVVMDDYVNPSRSRADINIQRGSAVFYVPTTMRNAKRELSRTTSHHPYSGFRVARTMPNQ